MAADATKPPRRLLNLWRRIIDNGGEIYRSPGQPLLRESSDWGVDIQREWPLQESPFWYFLSRGAQKRAEEYLSAAAPAHEKEG